MGVGVSSAGKEDVVDYCPREGSLDLECPIPRSRPAFLGGTLVRNQVEVVQEILKFWVHAAICLDCPALDLAS